MRFPQTCFIFLILAACAPSPEAIQTAIAKTQDMDISATISEQQVEKRLETALAGTLSSWITSTAAEFEIQLTTLTALNQTQAPLPSTTPLVPAEPIGTPTPSSTPTRPPVTPRPTLAPTDPPIIPSGPITITNAENIADAQVRLFWEADGSFVEGLVITWSKSNTEPEFPDNLWIRVEGSSRSTTIDVINPDTYTFRICEYKRPESCINYSNAFSFTVY